MNIGLFCKQFLGKGGFPREWRRFAVELAELGENLRIYSYPGTADTNLHPGIQAKVFPGSAASSFTLPASLRQALRQDHTWLDGMLIVGGFVPENITLMYWLRRYGIPYVISPLGQLAPKVIQRGGWKKRPFLHMLLLPALRRAAAIHVFSKIESDWTHHWLQLTTIRATHGAYPEDLPCNIDSNYLRSRFPFIGQRKIVLFLGRLDIYWKGLDTLIAGFKKVADKRKDLILLLVGPDQDNNRQRLQQLIEREHLTEQAVILDPIFGDDKFNAIASADLFAYPSNFDILPRSVREALTLGCPVLVSEETQFGDLVRQYSAGAVCDVTARSVATKITSLFSDESKLNSMGKNAQLLAKDELDWRREAKKLRDGLRGALLSTP